MRALVRVLVTAACLAGLLYGGNRLFPAVAPVGPPTPARPPDGWQIPLSRPVLTANRGQVDAFLPGTSSFDFVVKATGQTDTTYANVTSPFVVDPWLFAGRSVSVHARAAGRSSSPWSSAVRVDVAGLKLFGIVDAHGPQRKAGADAKGLGVTINRVEFSYGESISSMDAKVALDTSQGLTPLPLLSQYGNIAKFDLPGWQNWTRSVVARYGPGGSFWPGRSDSRYAPRIFELLNEPYGYWYYPRPDPAAYASFFVHVVSAAQAANPQVRFLLAAHPQAFRDAAGVFSAQTWDRMVKVGPDGGRALALAAGVTSHSYGSQQQVGLAAVAIHQDFPDLPVWITEIGYRIGETFVEGAARVTVTEDVQAARMQRSLVDYVSWPWAVAYVWFKWADYGPENRWGVVRADGSRRPSYATYRSFIAANGNRVPG